MILIENPIRGASRATLQEFLEQARRAVRLKGDVSVLVTSSDEVRALNRRFRRKDKPTDVLSFPSIAEGLSGDVVISRDVAAENARHLGHSLADEIRVLMLHGVLHLAGLDHESDTGEMERTEQRLRKRFGLPQTLIARTLAGPAPVRKSDVKKAAANGNQRRGASARKR